jgi:hypothetical protein
MAACSPHGFDLLRAAVGRRVHARVPVRKRLHMHQLLYELIGMAAIEGKLARFQLSRFKLRFVGGGETSCLFASR